MSIKHHPSEATLLAHAAGTAGPAVSAVVATHLAFCSACANTVHLLEAVGGAMLDEVSSEALHAGALERAIAATGTPIAAPVVDTPALLVEGLPCPAPLRPYLHGGWRWIAPGMRRMSLLDMDMPGGSLVLYRIEPHVGLPEHGHRGLELTCVLAGGFTDEFGSYQPGDVAEVDDTVAHRPLADSGEACICIVASQLPLKPRSWIASLLQPILGF